MLQSIPNYSEKTMDIVCEKTNMEVASIYLRKDFLRSVYNFLEKSNG